MLPFSAKALTRIQRVWVKEAGKGVILLESAYLSRMCVPPLQCICGPADVFVYVHKYLSTCKSICPHAEVFVHMQKYLSTCRSIYICRVAETICLFCHKTNRASWWSTPANHGDDQLHWTLDKPNYPLYNSNYPLDQPNYPIDQVESWGQRVVWGVSSCGWRGVLLFWESYFVLTAGISNSAHFIKVPTLYTQKL